VFAAGLAAALTASVLFNVGIALQGIEARSAPKALGLRLGLLGLLLRRRRWVVGWLLGVIGIAPQVFALTEAPFALVQPSLVVGLLVLLVLGSRTFGETVGPAEIAGVLAIVAGVALVAWGVPARTETQRGTIAVVAVVAGLAAGGIAPFLLRGTRFDTGMTSVIASGIGFAATNVATKLMSDAVGGGRYAAAAAWVFVGVVSGVAATIAGMNAFQHCRATTVVPVSTAVQTFLPLLLEPLFLNERWASAAFSGVPVAAGFAVALAGTVLTSRTRAVAKLSSPG
jgi:drug/metabolite transporter (DMT)-like permease